MKRIAFTLLLVLSLMISGAALAEYNSNNQGFEDDFDSYNTGADESQNYNTYGGGAAGTTCGSGQYVYQGNCSAFVNSNSNTAGLITKSDFEFNNDYIVATQDLEHTWSTSRRDLSKGVMFGFNDSTGDTIEFSYRDLELSGEGWRINGNIVNNTNYEGNSDMQDDVWHNITVVINKNSDTLKFLQGGTVKQQTDLTGWFSDPDSVSVYWESNSQGNFDRFSFDNVVANFVPNQYLLDGYVQNRDKQGINNANIYINESGKDTITAGDGSYSQVLKNGTYEVIANKSGFYKDKAVVEIAGSNEKQNFVLLKKNHRFSLIMQKWMKHGTTQPYKVEYVKVTDEGNLVPKDVTDSATVTSNNSTVVSVETSNNTLIATNDITINDRTYIRANYTDSDGQFFTTKKNITVANRTIDNIGIMPAEQYFNTFLGIGEDGTFAGLGAEVQWLYLIIIFGVIVTVVSKNEWLGLGAINISLILLWVLGYVGVGKFIVSLLFTIALGLSLTEIPRQGDINIEQDQGQQDFQNFQEFDDFER